MTNREWLQSLTDEEMADYIRTNPIDRVWLESEHDGMDALIEDVGKLAEIGPCLYFSTDGLCENCRIGLSECHKKATWRAAAYEILHRLEALR